MKIALINLINATCDTPDSLRDLIGLSIINRLHTDETSTIVELAKAMVDQGGHEVTIFISDEFKPMYQTVGYPNLNIEYLSTKFKSIFPPAFIPFTPSLYKRLRKGSFDVIMTVDFFQLGTIISVISSMNSDTKTIVWQDLNNFPRFPGNVIIKLYNISLGKILQRNIALFIPKSESARKFLLNSGIDSRKIYDTITVGVAANIFKPINNLSLSALGISISNRRIISSVARLHRQKGLEYLIRAMVKVVDKFPGVLLIIKGSGQLLSELESLINDLSLNNNIKILTELCPKYELVNLYNVSEFTVLASIYETFGFVVLESLACAKPVIVTNIDGPREIVLNEKIGYIVNPKSPTELADKMIELLADDKLRESMGLNGRNLILNKYDWEIVSMKFIESFQFVKSSS